MKRFFEWLSEYINGCPHQWVIFDRCNIVDGNGDKTGTRYHLRCSACGDIKKEDL